MPITPAVKAETESLVARDRAILTEELAGVVGGVNWTATLVLAEAGGIIAYRDLGKHTDVNLGFGFAILCLGLALAAFVVTALQVRRVQSAVTEFAFTIHSEISKAEQDPLVAGDAALRKTVAGAVGRLRLRMAWVNRSEILGLALFGLGSIWAILMLFSSELLALVPW